MGNLYRLNSLFELELAQFPRELYADKPIIERSIIFDYLFLFMSNPGDCTILGEKPSDILLDYWEKSKFQFGKTVTVENPYFANELPLNKGILKNAKLVEWGETSVIKNDKSSIKRKPSQISFSRNLNSKFIQLSWKDSLNLNRMKSVLCTSALELDYIVNIMKYPVVLKQEYGFSGRGNFILKDAQELKENLYRIKVAIRENKNKLIVEEWVGQDRVEDFSGLFDIKNRKVQFIAITRMVIDQFGVYKGSIISKKYDKELAYAIENELIQFKNFYKLYEGPLSIDGFKFKRDGKIETQYMSEINFRYSMGRVLFEIDQKLSINQKDCGLFFVPIKTKTPNMKAILSNINKIEKQEKIDIFLISPIQNEREKINPFACFYFKGESDNILSGLDQLKKLLT